MDTPTTIQLPLRGLLWLPGGSHVACDSGSLWITEDHQARDTVLQAGQSFASTTQGALLVYALSPAQLHRVSQS